MRFQKTTERPLAPAPLPVLAGVSLVTAMVLWPISSLWDWLATFLCLGVLAVGSVILDNVGRAEAQKHPHPLWYDQRLPFERSMLKRAVIVAVLAGLIFYAIQTAEFNEWGNPYPYFLAVSFLYLVMPQLFARRIRRRYDMQHGRVTPA